MPQEEEQEFRAIRKSITKQQNWHFVFFFLADVYIIIFNSFPLFDWE